MTDISKDIDAAIETSAKKASETLTGTFLNLAKEHIQKTKVRLKAGFEELSKHQYKKCSRVKTLLYRHEPAELLELYVPTTFHFGNKRTETTDTKLIEKALQGERYIVDGVAGSGKSVFMKFICLELIRKKDTFPIFIELRELNDEQNPSIMAFITKRFNEITGSFTLEQVQYGLRFGTFFLILDGFDELNFSIRDKVEREILSISQDYLKCGVVVSARKSIVFESWQNFTEGTVLPLTKQSIKTLISKLEFYTVIKQKFISRLNELYNTHKTFLSNPLLATMMLLTFEQFADIPNKIHIFYEQAFQTLFYKHDALKSAFRRDSYCKLPMDDFRRLLSAFCFITYIDEIFLFDRESLIKYAQKAKSYEMIELDENLWLKDLTESLCLLVLDGDSTSFAHRSFQEYFAAWFYTQNDIAERQVVNSLFERKTDSVVSLAFALNKEKVEMSYIVPKLSEAEKNFKFIDIETNPAFYLKGCSYMIRLTKDGTPEIQGARTNDWVNAIYRIFGLYGIKTPINKLFDERSIKEIMYKSPEVVAARKIANYFELRLKDSDYDLLIDTQIHNFLREVQRIVTELLETIHKTHENKKTLLSEIIMKKEKNKSSSL